VYIIFVVLYDAAADRYVEPSCEFVHFRGCPKSKDSLLTSRFIVQGIAAARHSSAQNMASRRTSLISDSAEDSALLEPRAHQTHSMRKLLPGSGDSALLELHIRRIV
jgi:hypothetical protein